MASVWTTRLAVGATAGIAGTLALRRIRRARRGRVPAEGVSPASAPAHDALPTASAADTLAVLSGVVLPTIAKGAIIRRPRVVAVSERLDLDSRAVEQMQRLRRTYGPGPLMLRVPLRNQAVVLENADLFRVLERSPEPFATASSEKRAALEHFQPEGVLVSHGEERQERRRFNEGVLQSDSPVHRLGERFVGVVREEARDLLDRVVGNGRELEWEPFSESWFRVVRRVVFGDTAREDHELRRLMDDLRSDANWAFLKPRRRGRRREFLARLNRHLDRAEPGSLAEVVASMPKSRDTKPDHQVPQWLFAFDPAGMTTFRTLALLAAHPEHAERAREEIAAAASAGAHPLPFLRACVLESLRLWPTTPMVLRQTTEATEWNGRTMPAGTGILIFAPLFHRDDERYPFAHRFSPEIWLEDDAALRGEHPRELPLIPFSAGPAVCPGRNLVLLVTSHMVASLLGGRELRLRSAERLDPGRLPGTLDHYSLSLELGRPQPSSRAAGSATG